MGREKGRFDMKMKNCKRICRFSEGINKEKTPSMPKYCRFNVMMCVTTNIPYTHTAAKGHTYAVASHIVW